MTHRDHLVSVFLTKKEGLPTVNINYAPMTKVVSDSSNQQVQSQIDSYNSYQQRISFDALPSIISPLQDNSCDLQEICTKHASFSPGAVSDVQYTSTPTTDYDN